MANKHEARIGRGLPLKPDRVFQVVFQLANVTDVATRAGAAMTTDIER
jgi:hypothetical protein